MSAVVESPVEPVVQPVVEVGGLRVRRGRRTVLDAVDLAIAPGEVVAVLGPNGAGKSTLLGAVGGLVRPAAGAVVVRGRCASVLQDPALARRSVRANVEAALAWWGAPRAGRRARAEAALEQVGVAHLARRPARALSGGEARRVHLARGLAVGADVLLLDEPFAGLDPDAHDRLVLDLATVLRERESATVVVVHERRDAWALADRVALVLAGRVVACARPDALLAAPPSEEAARFLGYRGELRDAAGGRLLVRDDDVVVDGAGEWEARVEQALRLERGWRLRVSTSGGSLWAVEESADAVHGVGSTVRLRVRGGLTWPPGIAEAPTLRP